MFEIIKLFIQQSFKLLNIPAILKARDQKRLAALGVDMFALYSSVNRIFTDGNCIVDTIEFILQKKDQYEKGNRLQESIADFGLTDLVQKQRDNIVDFSHAFVGLAKAVDVINPEASREMYIFLSGKRTLIEELFDELTNFYVARKMTVFGSHSEENLVRLVEDMKVSGRWITLGAWRRTRVDDEIVEINHGQIPVRQLKTLETYLQERKPRKHLDELEGILKDLHESLVKHFKIEDILLKIGDDRLVWHRWPARWHG